MGSAEKEGILWTGVSKSLEDIGGPLPYQVLQGTCPQVWLAACDGVWNLPACGIAQTPKCWIHIHT